MLRKTLPILFTGALLGAAVIAPDAALSQFGPPPGGPPPGLAGGPPPGIAGGPPPGLAGGPPPGLAGGGPAGLPRAGGPPGPRAASLPRPGVGGGHTRLQGGQGNLYGRSESYGRSGVYGRAENYDYGRSGSGYGDRSWRRRYWAPYGHYAYGESDSGDCYSIYRYSYRLRGYRRVWVCSED